MSLKLKLGQGEVFGVALMFVIIIVGVIVYAQIQALKPNFEEDEALERKYQILARDTIDTIKSTSTGCTIDRGDDSLSAMISYCFNYADEESLDGPNLIGCDNVVPPGYGACSYSMKVLNDTLQVLFSSNYNKSVLGSIPFSISFSNEDYQQAVFHEKVLTNFDDFDLSLNRSDDDYYLENGYKKVSGGFNTISTGRRNLELDLAFYYQ